LRLITIIPTNFLSLPRELRFAILLQTPHTLEYKAWWSYEYTLARIKDWVATLREVRDDIVEDFFVEKKWWVGHGTILRTSVEGLHLFEVRIDMEDCEVRRRRVCLVRIAIEICEVKGVGSKVLEWL
jgi:hypothetical protein